LSFISIKEDVNICYILAFTRYSLTSKRLYTNQSSFLSSRPPALATLLQHECTTIGQYASPSPTSLVYAIQHAILVIQISCKGQFVYIHTSKSGRSVLDPAAGLGAAAQPIRVTRVITVRVNPKTDSRRRTIAES